ncbi:putative hemolysin [Vibrio nereis]|uniref:Hemolysin n=1 Tax=Vibrio nereis TaxID=693 RepID=A0A0M0HSE0_VIBNE|nr:DUF333 domain-containing protein [Vibrio nereis]KOO04533.1 hemolysin [Vibrio nereis]
MKMPLFFCTVAGSMLLVGCNATLEDYQERSYTSMANPASVYCVQQQGQLKTITEEGQRVTYCLLPNNQQVEQWEHFRARPTTSESDS